MSGQTRPIAVIELPIEPVSNADRTALADALARIAAADPAFGYDFDREGDRVVLHGASERRLDSACRHLLETDRIAIEVGAPQVAYRETLTRQVTTDFTYRTHNPEQFARVVFVFAPDSQGSSFESVIVGGVVPDVFLAAAAAGIASVRAGVLAGYPVLNVKATMTDGAFHNAHSSVLAFEQAARLAFLQTLRQAVLTEPVMSVEVTTPEEFGGSVRRDLSGRGYITREHGGGGTVVIDANVPVANLFGYANQLRSMSEGRATHVTRFDHYAPVNPTPPDRPRFPPVAGALRVA